MAMLFRKFLHRKPPHGLLEISDRVYVFDCCFTNASLEEEDKNYYKTNGGKEGYIADIVAQLRRQFPDASLLLFNFKLPNMMSSNITSTSHYDMTVMDYPAHYQGCPILSLNLIHHFLRSTESWLALGPNNILLLHCAKPCLPVLTFVIASLLIYRKQFTDEHRTLDMVYNQAPPHLLPILSPLNPIPSQLRYLQYVSRRNVASRWPPPDTPLKLDCIVFRSIPDFNEGGCRPLFRIYGHDPLISGDPAPKLLFSTLQKNKPIRFYKQVESELAKIDFNCCIQGDVVLECTSLQSDMKHEDMMFRIVFNTGFVRSNILIFNRDEIDMMWNTKDHFPNNFRAEVLFSEMDTSASVVASTLSCFEEKEGLSLEAFSKIQEFFSHIDWLDSRVDAALSVIQELSASNCSRESLNVVTNAEMRSPLDAPKPQKPNEDMAGVQCTSKIQDGQDTLSSHLLRECNLGEDETQFQAQYQSIAKTPQAGVFPTSSSAHQESDARLPTAPLKEGISQGTPTPSFPPPEKQTSSMPRRESTLSSNNATLSSPLPSVAAAQILHSGPISSESSALGAKSLTQPASVMPDSSIAIPTNNSAEGRPTPNSSPCVNPSIDDIRMSELPSPPPPPPPPLPPPSIVSPVTSLKKCGSCGPAVPHSHQQHLSPPPPPPPPSPNIRTLSQASKSEPQASSPGPGAPPPPVCAVKGTVKTGCAIPPPRPPLSPLIPRGKNFLSSIGPRNSQAKKLKPLHWQKLNRAVQGSLWAEAKESKGSSNAPEIDVSELENLFSASVPISDRGASSGKSNLVVGGPKSGKVQLVDHRRAYNCEIMLSKVKIPFRELTGFILSLNDPALDVDQVDNLIKFCPTKEEMEVLKGYTGEPDNLGKCEQFFLELMRVPRVEAKLRVLSFKMQFRTQVSDLRNSLSSVNCALNQIRNSGKLKRIMQTILSLGNALNQGTARGAAVGFRLDSLLKLTDIRARNNKMNLMHYLCKVIAEKSPDLLDVSKDLTAIEPASKIQLKYLAEEMQAINKGLEQVVQELSMSENDGPVSEKFHRNLKEFLSFAEAEVRSLASLYSDVGRNVDATIVYFGEDPSRCSFEQVVSTILNFTRMFNRAHEENCQQLVREEKKAEKEVEIKKRTIVL